MPADQPIAVTFLLPGGRTVQEIGTRGQTLLALALAHGLDLEHTCGGVGACSTCHVHVKAGMASLSPATEEEMDQVEQAPDVGLDSRLACQCRLVGPGPVTVQVPAWNRNAVREGH